MMGEVIAIVHPDMSGRGGSEAVCCWAIQALCEQYSVTLITQGGADFSELNKAYGTRIDSNLVSVINTGYLPRKLAKDALSGAWFHRKLKGVVARVVPSLVISIYGLVDVPFPAIQRIADFSWDDEIRQRLHGQKVRSPWYHKASLLRSMYLGACRSLAGFSLDRALRPPNLVVSNSKWTARLLLEKHGMESRVIYPPVAAAAKVDGGLARKLRFVCLGRISPEKELEKVIEVITQVRAQGYDASLHFLGRLDSAYASQLKAQAASAGDWIVFEGAKYGAEKQRFLNESAFAIHGCQSEAFGIAVAELVQSGCITFVPDVGGQSEIIEDTRLLYSDVDDAVAKIVAVMGNVELQHELRAISMGGASRFSAERFMEEVRVVVSEVID